MMSLYEGAKTRVRVDFVLSDEFEVKVWMSFFPFAFVVDAVIEFARVCVK